MTNEEKIFEVAKELFLRADKPKYVNDSNRDAFNKLVINCVEMAKEFVKVIEDET